MLGEIEMAFELGIERCPNGEGKKSQCLTTRKRQEEHMLKREQPKQRH